MLLFHSISTLVVAGSWSKVDEIEALCVHVKITAVQKYSKAPKEVPFIRAAGSHWAPASRSMPSHSPCVARAGSQKLSQADKSSGIRSTCPKQKKPRSLRRLVNWSLSKRNQRHSYVCFYVAFWNLPDLQKGANTGLPVGCPLPHNIPINHVYSDQQGSTTTVCLGYHHDFSSTAGWSQFQCQIGPKSCGTLYSGLRSFLVYEVEIYGGKG